MNQWHRIKSRSPHQKSTPKKEEEKTGKFEKKKLNLDEKGGNTYTTGGHGSFLVAALKKISEKKELSKKGKKKLKDHHADVGHLLGFTGKDKGVRNPLTTERRERRETRTKARVKIPRRDRRSQVVKGTTRLVRGPIQNAPNAPT